MRERGGSVRKACPMPEIGTAFARMGESWNSDGPRGRGAWVGLGAVILRWR